MHNSLIDALVSQEIRRQRDADAAASAAARKAANRDGVMMRRAYRRYWRRKIAEARRMYGDNPHPSRVERAVLGVYGLVIVKAAGWWSRAAGAYRR